MPKAETHDNCPKSGHYSMRTRGTHSAETLYHRDPATRQMKAIGVRCRRCGSVKMEYWRAWTLAS